MEENISVEAEKCCTRFTERHIPHPHSPCTSSSPGRIFVYRGVSCQGRIKGTQCGISLLLPVRLSRLRGESQNFLGVTGISGK
jgi:hypothetical protein